jgi:hypothetical protein
VSARVSKVSRTSAEHNSYRVRTQEESYLHPYLRLTVYSWLFPLCLPTLSSTRSVPIASSSYHRNKPVQLSFNLYRLKMKAFRRLPSGNALLARPAKRINTAQKFASTRLWQRPYSNFTTDRSAGLPGLDASKLSITKTTTPKELTPPKDLVFGNTFSGKLLLCLGDTLILTMA